MLVYCCFFTRKGWRNISKKLYFNNQEKLAEISEVEPRTIQRLERGDSVSKQTLLKIVIALSSYHNIKIKIFYELHKTHQNPEILLKFSFISILDHILKSKYKKATK